MVTVTCAMGFRLSRALRKAGLDRRNRAVDPGGDIAKARLGSCCARLFRIEQARELVAIFPHQGKLHLQSRPRPVAIGMAQRHRVEPVDRR